MSDSSIIMLAGPGKYTNIVYHSLDNEFEIGKILIENERPKRQIAKKRLQEIGFLKVMGQVFFILIVPPCLRFTSQKRISQIMDDYDLNPEPVNSSSRVDINSVNSEKTIKILKEKNPDIVIVNGTRIISRRVLNCVRASFLNMHVGITPLYRGVHGAYWALVENNEEACGVTVFLVDTGIDTGEILGQRLIEPTSEDNFLTYPLLQIAEGIPLLKEAIRNLYSGEIEKKDPPEGKSKLWAHPTLWEYLYNWFRHGIK